MKAFLRAFSKGMKDVRRRPKASVATVKARDGIVNEDLELRRLKLALDATVLTPDAKGRGLRQRDAAAPVADGEPGLRRVATERTRNATAVWNGSPADRRRARHLCRGRDE